MAINILLLLNDPEIKDIVTRAISGLAKGKDIEVYNVEEGQTALDLLNEIVPDLLIAEIFIPGKNGIALCRYVKQQPELKDLRVVLLDEYVEPFRQQVANEIGADAYLGKPFQAEDLSEHICRLSGIEALAAGDEGVEEGVGKSLAANTTGPAQQVTKLQGSATAAPITFSETRQIVASAETPAEASPPGGEKSRSRFLYAVIAAVLLIITGLTVAMRADRPQVGIAPQQARPAATTSQTVPPRGTAPDTTAAARAEEKPGSGEEGSDQAAATAAERRAMKSGGPNAAGAPAITKVGKNLAGGVKTIGVGGARATAKAGRKVGGALKRIF